jgi:RNA-binding protein
MERLKGFQKKHLRGLAHSKKPVVFIGQKGLTPEVVQAADNALIRHELIKVKFLDFKEKDRKTAVATALEDETGSEMVGMIGHMAVFFRRNTDPEKRKIAVPEREG